MKLSSLAIVLLAAILAAACGDDTPTTPSPTTPASPVTWTLSSRLTPQGSVSRTFAASTAGTISVTLASAGPAGTRVGLGIGVPLGGVSNCRLGQSITTTAGASPQISVSADAGTYCIAVFDIGTLTDTISFDLTIVTP